MRGAQNNKVLNVLAASKSLKVANKKVLVTTWLDAFTTAISILNARLKYTKVNYTVANAIDNLPVE